MFSDLIARVLFSDNLRARCRCTDRKKNWILKKVGEVSIYKQKFCAINSKSDRIKLVIKIETSQDLTSAGEAFNLSHADL